MSNERLATVEARVENIDSRLDELHRDVREIRDSLSKQRGFIAGASFVFTLLASAIAALISYIFKGNP